MKKHILVLVLISWPELLIAQKTPSNMLDAKTFLQSLREFRYPSYILNDTLPFTISEADIPLLIDSLDSKDSCVNVASTFSSFFDTKTSTIAHESAFMIQGFRVGKYPPGLNSSRFRWSKQEIAQWWKKYQANKK